MRDSLFKMFGSVRLVQEVTRSNQPNTSANDTEATFPSSVDTTMQHTNSPVPSTSGLHTTDYNNTNNYSIKNNNKTVNLDHSHIHLAETYSSRPDYEKERSVSDDTSKQNPQPLMNWISEPIPNHHSAALPSNKSRLANNNAKSYTRKNSKYAVRHHRPRSFSNNTKTDKGKSQKLLCLWPLPVVTRYMIVIALLVSTLNFLNVIHLSCSAPSYVIHRLDIKNLIFSPFLFNWTVPNIVLYGWNILILGLFEESLSHMVGGTLRFVELLGMLFSIVSGLRILLGFVFSKSTGWAVPSLFFSNSMHECSQGLSPFLFALLVVQSLSIDDKYILIYGQANTNSNDNKLTVRKVTLQLLMCLANYTSRNILWWSVSGLVTGFVATILLQTVLAFEKRTDSGKVKDMAEFITLERYRRTPLWRLIWSAIQKGTMVVGLTVPILMLWNSYYTREFKVTPAELNTISQDPYLFTFIFMTAPRRGDPAYLTRTIESYLANWPEYPAADSPYRRMQAVIYTHFSNHTQFESAKAHFSNTVKGQQYLRWIHEEGEELNQRLHVSKALDQVSNQYRSTYYALMEDDFPVCGLHEWHEIENVIYKAEKNAPHHCGVFVGTGGSGLFLKPSLARLSSRLLLQYKDMPPDIIIQRCLMGDLPECSSCANSLVTSKTLLMYHIGYNTSTSQDRVYKKDEFQCGWRHPFNGDPSVVTL